MAFLNQDGTTPLTGNWGVGNYDITNVKLFSGKDISISDVLTNTASGALSHTSFVTNIAPTADSLSTFCSHYFQVYPDAGVFTLNELNAGYFEGARFKNQTGNVSTIRGILTQGMVLDENSAASVSATNVTGLNATGYSRSSGTSTASINALYGVYINMLASAGATVNAVTGLGIVNPTGGSTISSLVGINIPSLSRGTTSNIGLRIFEPSGATNNYALQLGGTGGTPASGITFGTDTNLYRSAANLLQTDDDFKAPKVIVDDSNFYLDIIAGMSRVNFDNTDFMDFNRSTNTFRFDVGNIDLVTISPSLTSLNNSLAVGGTSSESFKILGKTTNMSPINNNSTVQRIEITDTQSISDGVPSINGLWVNMSKESGTGLAHGVLSWVGGKMPIGFPTPVNEVQCYNGVVSNFTPPNDTWSTQAVDDNAIWGMHLNIVGGGTTVKPPMRGLQIEMKKYNPTSFWPTVGAPADVPCNALNLVLGPPGTPAADNPINKGIEFYRSTTGTFSRIGIDLAGDPENGLVTNFDWAAIRLAGNNRILLDIGANGGVNTKEILYSSVPNMIRLLNFGGSPAPAIEIEPRLCINQTGIGAAGDADLIFNADAAAISNPGGGIGTKINLYGGNANHLIGIRGGGMWFTSDSHISFWQKDATNIIERFTIDTANAKVTLPSRTSNPPGQAGAMYYNSSAQEIRVCVDGTNWRAIQLV